MKKRFGLICVFSLYHFFIPFVMVNCGQDAPYDRTAIADEGEEDVAADESSNCESNEFLTADCVAAESEALTKDAEEEKSDVAVDDESGEPEDDDEDIDSEEAE